MRGSTIARNYAGALLELGRTHGEGEAYLGAFAVLDEAIASDPRIGRFLETPRIDVQSKQEVVRQALEGRVPERFLRFVLVVIGHERQRLLPDIRRHYQALLDEAAGLVHARITVAREPSDGTVQSITGRLSAMLGREVVPDVTVDPAVLGGFVVRYEDWEMDGSLRRQLMSLRREMMHAPLPERPAASA